MTRRPVLPGASELFRRTDAGASVPEVTELPNLSTTTSSPALRGRQAEESPSAPLTLVPGGAVQSPDDLASYRASSERRPGWLRSAGELVVVLRLGSSVTSGTEEPASVRRKSSEAPGRTGRRVIARGPPWRGRGTPRRPTTWAPTW